MEGTSGAADCVPFREGTREAALSGGGLAKAGLSPGGYVKTLIEGLHRRRHLHVNVEACSRHEVSEPIGLGNLFSSRAIVVEGAGIGLHPCLAPDP
jgi:ABC-type nickel/cobalt efflux system permease component RcnA